MNALSDPFPNWIVPTPPVGDSSHRVADTEFVTSAVTSAIASAYAGTTGFVLQTVYNETTSFIIGNAQMQGNQTSIPVKTDGIQIVTATITPSSTTNKLLVRALVPMTQSSANNTIVALFQDTTTAALAAAPGGNDPVKMFTASLAYNLTAGTTGPTTFKINVMNISTFAASWAVNGIVNPQIAFLGGSLRATLVIQETKG